MKTKIEELEVGDKVLVKFLDNMPGKVIMVAETSVLVEMKNGIFIPIDESIEWTHTGQTWRKSLRDFCKSIIDEIGKIGCDQS